MALRFDGGETVHTRFTATAETAMASELDGDAERDFAVRPRSRSSPSERRAGGG